MSELEGVIRFRCDLTPAPAPGTSGEPFVALNAWRGILHRLSLLGQCPSRYDGLAYGNASMRVPDGKAAFLISASQTSAHAATGPEDWVLVDQVDIDAFWMHATGLKAPSSESMTHAMIYRTDPAIRYVLHAHSPDIWRSAAHLALPQTPASAAYGTPALAAEVDALLHAHLVRPLVFTTRGHEDGVFACGPDLPGTATAMIACLARALADGAGG